MINSDLQKAIAASEEIAEQETVNDEDAVEEVSTLETASKEVDVSETISTVEEKDVCLPTQTEAPSVPHAKQDYLWEVIPPVEPLELLPSADAPSTVPPVELLPSNDVPPAAPPVEPVELLPSNDVPPAAPVATDVERTEGLIKEESRPENGPISEG